VSLNLLTNKNYGGTSGGEEHKFCMKKLPPHTKIRFYLFFLRLLKNWRQNARRGVNFTNILRTSFTHTDLKSTKNTVRPSVFFVLLGFAFVKAAHKMLVKSTPGFVCVRMYTLVHLCYVCMYGKSQACHVSNANVFIKTMCQDTVHPSRQACKFWPCN